jgi:hypothetical protein
VSGQMSDAGEVGREFAQALAAKDFDRATELLHPEVDFRGLTPNRTWEATNRSEVVERVLRQWFEEKDEIEVLTSVETGSFADRDHIAYAFRGRNPDGPFAVEQQVYFTAADGRITWMRVLCSGFRPG